MDHRVLLGRLMLATGLVVSAGLLAEVGGGPGLALGAAQVAAAVAIGTRRESPWPGAWSVLALILGPVAAILHWTAQLPVSCRCARLFHPPPGLVSLTSLVVVLDLALVGSALWLTAAGQTAEVGKSSP